ncbi:hypothetical protein L208DRAFT_1375710 [Tricholoma matsutake]|nr:hypothetical protein L208DRAFT_1375710 [Tricholoma matsutake 945]
MFKAFGKMAMKQRDEATVVYSDDVLLHTMDWSRSGFAEEFGVGKSSMVWPQHCLGIQLPESMQYTPWEMAVGRHPLMDNERLPGEVLHYTQEEVASKFTMKIQNCTNNCCYWKSPMFKAFGKMATKWRDEVTVIHSDDHMWYREVSETQYRHRGSAYVYALKLHWANWSECQLSLEAVKEVLLDMWELQTAVLAAVEAK